MNVAKTIRSQTGPLAQAGMVSLWGARSLIKSIQRGTISMLGVGSNTSTISAVDVANAVCVYEGHTSDDAGITRVVVTARVDLTNATTVTATDGLAVGTQVVSYEVIEFMPGVLKSSQRGTISMGVGVGSGTATVTEVDTSKAQLLFCGYTIDAFTTNASVASRLALTNGTTVTATRPGTANTTVTSFALMEYF